MRFDNANSIRSDLLQEMKYGEYSRMKRLPKEIDLAKKYGISRNHLREVLTQLEMEGFITRIHGVGTLINRHVINVKNRMDIETEFLEIIQQNGHSAKVSNVRMQVETADAHIASKLQIKKGTEVVRVCRTCEADGKTAIYCEDVFEKRLIKQTYKKKDLEPPIFHFLKKICGVEAYMDLTQLHAVLADEFVAKELGIPLGTPLLKMEEVDYDLEGNIIFYSDQYFMDQYFEQTVLRKKFT